MTMEVNRDPCMFILPFSTSNYILTRMENEGVLLLNTLSMSPHVNRTGSIAMQNPISMTIFLSKDSRMTISIFYIPSPLPHFQRQSTPSWSSMAPGCACWESVGRPIIIIIIIISLHDDAGR